MNIAYSDGYADLPVRSQYLGDPDFITIPASQLISAPYAHFRRQQIDMNPPSQRSPTSQRRNPRATYPRK